MLARSIGPIKLGEMRATAQAKAGHEKHIVAKGDTHYYPRLELFIGYKNGRVAVISDSSNAATASGDPLAGTQYGTAHSCLGLGSGYPHFTAIYPHAACASGLYGGEPGQPDKYKNTVCTVGRPTRQLHRVLVRRSQSGNAPLRCDRCRSEIRAVARNPTLNDAHDPRLPRPSCGVAGVPRSHLDR